MSSLNCEAQNIAPLRTGESFSSLKETFCCRVMVEPRTRSRDLVEAVVRGRQVMSACIVIVGLCWLMSSLLG